MLKYVREWSVDSVRDICVKHQYYLWGDNAEYTKLMRFIRTHKPTNRNISIVAMDVYKHSDSDFSLEEVAEDVASVIRIHVVSE